MTVTSNTGKGLEGICTLSKPLYLFQTSFSTVTFFDIDKLASKDLYSE